MFDNIFMNIVNIRTDAHPLFNNALSTDLRITINMHRPYCKPSKDGMNCLEQFIGLKTVLFYKHHASFPFSWASLTAGI